MDTKTKIMAFIIIVLTVCTVALGIMSWSLDSQKQPQKVEKKIQNPFS